MNTKYITEILNMLQNIKYVQSVKYIYTMLSILKKYYIVYYRILDIIQNIKYIV